MYLFDTDIITNVLKPHPNKGLILRLSALPRTAQFISTITISEIVYGARRSSRPEYHLQNLQNILLPTLNIVDFDAKAAYLTGGIRAELEALGKPLAFADIQIAAIALANDLVLVTGNQKHFSRILELRIENWLA